MSLTFSSLDTTIPTLKYALADSASARGPECPAADRQPLFVTHAYCGGSRQSRKCSHGGQGSHLRQSAGFPPRPALILFSVHFPLTNGFINSYLWDLTGGLNNVTERSPGKDSFPKISFPSQEFLEPERAAFVSSKGTSLFQLGSRAFLRMGFPGDGWWGHPQVGIGSSRPV